MERASSRALSRVDTRASEYSHDALDWQNSWVEKAFKVGLLRPAAVLSAAASGVSLSFLEAFALSIDFDEDQDSEAPSTSYMMHKLVLPAIARKTGLKKRLIDFIPPECTGTPQHYICHAWGASFKDLVQAISEELAPTPGPAEPPLRDGFKDEIFLSIDLFNSSLYTNVQTQNTLTSQAFESIDAEVHAAITSCSKGLLLVMDRELLAMERVWIMYELFMVAYRAAKSHVFILLAFPDRLPLSRITRLKELILNVDINKADATFPSHKAHILQLIRKRCGVQKTNSVVANLLTLSLHNALRWRGGLWGKGTLAAILWLDPNGSKLRLLRLLLNSIDQLSNDESQLQFMRDLFISYDTDGSGELDEEEFVGVLMQAGWEESAALGAYYNVNTDGQGGVGIEEFENWWRKQSSGEDTHNPGQKSLAIEMTRGCLKVDIERMPGLMDRNDLKELAKIFVTASGKIDDAWLFKTMPPILLDAEVTRGLEQISVKVASKDYRTACPIAYDLLYGNAQLLDVDVSLLALPETKYPSSGSNEEPTKVPLVKKASSQVALAAASAVDLMDKTYHPNLLVSYLEALGSLLRYCPGLREEQNLLIESLCQIKEELDESEEAELKRALNAKGGASMAPRDRQFGGGHFTTSLGSKSQMREALRAKFGSKEIVTEGKMKLFQVALSQFVAATRGLSAGGHSRSASSSPDPRGKQAVAAAQTALKASHDKMAELRLPSLADLRKKQTMEARKHRDSALEDEFGPGLIDRSGERARSFSSTSMRVRNSEADVGPSSGSKSSSQLLDEAFEKPADDDVFADTRMRINTESHKSLGSRGSIPLVSPCARGSPTGGSLSPVPGWGLRSGKSVTRFSVAFLPDAPPMESLMRRVSSVAEKTEDPGKLESSRTMSSQRLARLTVFRESAMIEEEEGEGEKLQLPDINGSKRTTYSGMEGQIEADRRGSMAGSPQKATSKRALPKRHSSQINLSERIGI